MKRNFLISVLWLIAAANVGAVVTVPTWWQNLSDFNDWSPSFDHEENKEPARVGQLKNFALEARKHLDAILAEAGGAGLEIESMVGDDQGLYWRSSDPHKEADWVVNLGQVKYVASRFYNRLTALGLREAGSDGLPLYPWSEADRFNLLLLPKFPSAVQLPTTGQQLVVVADLDIQSDPTDLRLLIFDGACNLTSIDELALSSASIFNPTRIANLEAMLGDPADANSLWNSDNITSSQAASINAAVVQLCETIGFVPLPEPDDFKAANVGQVKNSFLFEATAPNGEDLDEGGAGDFVPDYIERILGFDPDVRDSVRQGDGIFSGDRIQYVRLHQDGTTLTPPGLSPDIPDPPVSLGSPTDHLSKENAGRFLCQAGWGPDLEEINRVRGLGFAGWIDDQLGKEFPTAAFPGQNGTPEDGKFFFDYSLIAQADGSGDAAIKTDHPLNQPNFPLEYSFEAYLYYLEWVRNHAHRSRETPFGFENATVYDEGGWSSWRYWENSFDPSPNERFGWVEGGNEIHKGRYLTSQSDRLFSGLWKELRSENLFTAWMRRIVHDDDVFRQRVAWSLSQIFVVSLDDTVIKPFALASYYEMLNRRAFGNYRDLLYDVAMHPAMGRYLSHMFNQASVEGSPRVPDENFAREVMQLFSIGLWQLNRDGSRMLNNGQLVPTYDNEDVKALAQVFTGLGPDRHDDNGANGFWGAGGKHNGFSYYMARPMVMWDDHPVLENRYPIETIPEQQTHDYEAKTLFAGKRGERALVVPDPSANNAISDVEQAIDTLFEHPNTAPFISRLLIQHLVKSHPSPAYIDRVAAVFEDDESGRVDEAGEPKTRGNLDSVVRAILLDPEARSAKFFLFDGHHAKLRAPMLRLVHLIKAFRAGTNYNRWGPENPPGTPTLPVLWSQKGFDPQPPTTVFPKIAGRPNPNKAPTTVTFTGDVAQEWATRKAALEASQLLQASHRISLVAAFDNAPSEAAYLTLANAHNAMYDLYASLLSFYTSLTETQRGDLPAAHVDYLNVAADALMVTPFDGNAPPSLFDAVRERLDEDDYKTWRDRFADYATEHGLDSSLQWFWSRLNVGNDDDNKWRSMPYQDFGQMFLKSPSVFNFFQPDYRHPGQIANTWVHDAWLTSPEFQILDDVWALRTPNRLWTSVEEPLDSHFPGSSSPFWTTSTQLVFATSSPQVGLEDFALRHSTVAGLGTGTLAADKIDTLNLLLANGRMHSQTRAALEAGLPNLSPADDSSLTQYLIKVLVASPESAVLK